VTLAECINISASLIAIGLGVRLVLAGALGLVIVGLADRDQPGSAVFIRLVVSAIVVGLLLFFAGSIAAIRVIV